MEFHSLRVSDLHKTTPDCTLVSFEIPADLKEKYAFQAGQYLTLKAKINGEEVRRSYSLCSSPIDGIWQIGVKMVPQGKFSTFVNEALRVGDQLTVAPPDGRFHCPTTPEKRKKYVAFAAGSGITPVFSIVSTKLRLEPDAHCSIFYVNQGVNSIILKEELEALKNQFMQRFELFHFLTREKRDIPMFDGRIDESKLKKLFQTVIDPDDIDDYFICGPEPMIFLIRDFLLDQGIDSHRIHFELFNTGGTGAHGSPKQEERYKGKVSEITVFEGGKSFNFIMDQGTDNILDAAIARSADLPFACKGGVCCTCRAKLQEGEVEMRKNFGLEQDEIDDGYILTCQALPVSEKVVINYDS